MFEKLIINNGEIRLNDCIFDSNANIEDICENLKEDLLQIELNNTYIIDVGWYPEFEIKGNFKIVVIENYDWLKFKEEYETKDLKEMEQTIKFLLVKYDQDKV